MTKTPLILGGACLLTALTVVVLVRSEGAAHGNEGLLVQPETVPAASRVLQDVDLAPTTREALDAIPEKSGIVVADQEEGVAEWRSLLSPTPVNHLTAEEAQRELELLHPYLAQFRSEMSKSANWGSAVLVDEHTPVPEEGEGFAVLQRGRSDGGTEFVIAYPVDHPDYFAVQDRITELFFSPALEAARYDKLARTLSLADEAAAQFGLSEEEAQAFVEKNKGND